MSEFKVKITQNRWGAQVFKIVDDNHKYLHSDGVVYPCGEYWPTEKQAQAVLDKFQPRHKWVHGDVFANVVSDRWIYLCPESVPIVVDMNRAGGGGTPECQLEGATFLFNIKDALSYRGLA